MLAKLLAGTMLIATPAFAQTPTTSPAAPNATVPEVTNPGGPGAVNSGPGATGTVRTEATGAGTVSNNPAGDGNSSQPNQASTVPGSPK